MGADLTSEVNKLVAAGKTPVQIRLALAETGFSSDDIAAALTKTVRVEDRAAEDVRNSRLLATRETFDRIGYGTVPPQFVNILLWLTMQTNAYVFFAIGVLNGLKTLLSVIVSSILQEYNRLHRTSKNAIASAGIVFGFSFIVIAFALLTRNLWLFSIALLTSTVAVVAYGDNYQQFVHETIKKERMGAGLRRIAHWGVIVTTTSMIVAGYLLEKFPIRGVPFTMQLLGKTMSLNIYGYLLAFQITAFAFIIGGYITSLVVDKREERTYSFWAFFVEHHREVKSKVTVFWKSKYITLLTIATIISGLLQILITAYSGIAIYRILDKQYAMPFVLLAIIYAIAVVASFTGPFFTQKIHRSTGLAPTLVFGTMLAAILPLVLWYSDANIVIIAVAVCLNVIGSAITGFAQGMLAQKIMDEETHHAYFQAQGLVLIIPYLILIPALAWMANSIPLATTFLVTAIGLVAVVMPLYFILVVVSQKLRL